MIYSRNDGTKSRTVTFNAGVWERPEKPPSPDATTVIPTVTEYNFSDIEPHVPVKLHRRKLRREARKLKVGARTPVWMAILCCTTIFGFCGIILYLCFSGQLLPDVATNAVYGVFSTIYKPQNVSKTSNFKTADDFSDPSSPVYLAEKPVADAVPLSTSQTDTSDDGSEAASSDKAQQASVQNGGTTGADGKIYLPLTESDLSVGNLSKLNNQTSYAVDFQTISEDSPKAVKDLTLSDEPVVLILHTHATECYSSGDGNRYDSAEPTRCDDTENNMVRVGKEISKVLNDFGVCAIQSDVLHDKASFIKAYSASKNTAQWYLDHYPSIRFVLDVHRDAIIRNDGEKIKPVTDIAGEKYAQIMLVVGTDEGGSDHKNWMDNLSLALALQKETEARYPHLCRPINLRTASFNQQLSSGYLLVEVGSCGNSQTEALRSARAFGTSLACYIRENAKGS